MQYFKTKDNEILKYNVFFNYDNLKNLCDEITINCGVSMFDKDYEIMTYKPHIVTLIESLLNKENCDLLNYISNTNNHKDPTIYDFISYYYVISSNKIKENKNIETIENSIEELERLKKSILLNKEKKDVTEYFNKIKYSIILDYVGKINVNDFNKYDDFFNKEEFISKQK